MVDFLQEKYGEVTALFFQPTLLHGQQWFVARFKNRDEALSVICARDFPPLSRLPGHP